MITSTTYQAPLPVGFLFETGAACCCRDTRHFHATTNIVRSCTSLVQAPVFQGFRRTIQDENNRCVLPIKPKFLFETKGWREPRKLLYFPHTKLIYKLSFHI